jgi:adenine-specific DNA-methyltransferase
VLLTALMEASDRVDSTVGVQMAYLKSWAPRALRPVTLRLPELLPRSPFGPSEAYLLDALDAATLDADVAYLDPPYNQHSYLGNYHVWETLVRWDEPETFGIACKRVDVQQRRSAFNSKRQIAATMQSLIERVRAERLVVSFSDEGAISAAAMAQLLLARGHVQVLRRGHERYVGSKIGIYGPSGKLVGKPGRSRNIEHVFVVTPQPWAGGAALVQAGLCDDVVSGDSIVAAAEPAPTSSRRARS